MTDCDICLTLREEPERQSPEEGNTVCDDHIVMVSALLVHIARRAAFMSDPEHLRRTTDLDTERWVGSRAPLDTTTVAALDRRSVATHRGDPISAERVLRAWLYAALDLTAPAGGEWWSHDLPMPRFPLPFICTLLLTHLPALATTPGFARFARHVAAVHRSLERLTPSY